MNKLLMMCAATVLFASGCSKHEEAADAPMSNPASTNPMPSDSAPTPTEPSSVPPPETAPPP